MQLKFINNCSHQQEEAPGFVGGMLPALDEADDEGGGEDGDDVRDDVTESDVAASDGRRVRMIHRRFTLCFFFGEKNAFLFLSKC